MTPDADIELLQRAWEALSQGDLSVIEAALTSDAKWRGVEEGQRGCESPKEILEMMGRNLDSGLQGEVAEMIRQDGSHILAAFRPSRSREDDRPLEDGIAWVVVTLRDGKIAELKGCADRATAEAYAEADRRSLNGLRA